MKGIAQKKKKQLNILMEPNDVLTGPVINSIVTDDDEPLPSLSDFHDYEPNLEFDDSELTHPPLTNGMYCNRTNTRKNAWIKLRRRSRLTHESCICIVADCENRSSISNSAHNASFNFSCVAIAVQLVHIVFLSAPFLTDVSQ